MIWVLTIVYGITWAGAGGAMHHEFPSEDSCYRALKEMKIAGAPIESQNRRDTIAYCRPKGATK